MVEHRDYNLKNLRLDLGHGGSLLWIRGAWFNYFNPNSSYEVRRWYCMTTKTAIHHSSFTMKVRNRLTEDYRWHSWSSDCDYVLLIHTPWCHQCSKFCDFSFSQSHVCILYANTSHPYTIFWLLWLSWRVRYMGFRNIEKNQNARC